MGKPSPGELCEAILSASPDHIYVLDRGGVYQYVSPAGAHALGLDPEAMIGRTWRDLGFSSESMLCFDRERETVFATGQAAGGITQLPTLMGLRDHQYVVKPLNREGGEITHVVCVASDVTDRGNPPLADPHFHDAPGGQPLDLRLDIDLREALGAGEPGNWRDEGTLRRVADALPALIAYIDGEERYRFNNRAYTRWFNEGPEAIHGRTIREVLGDAAYEVVRPYVEAANRGQRVTYEAVIPYSSGGSRRVRANYLPDRHPQGPTRGFFAVVYDLGESPPDDDEGRGSAPDPTARAAIVNDMTAEIIHEISQPLSAITSYSQACLRVLDAEDTDPRDIQPWLKDLDAQARRARDLVLRIRSLSRTGEPRRAVVDLSRLVPEVVTLARRESDTHRIRCEDRTSDQKCLVLGDELLLQQVVLNLLRNAMEAMAGHPEPHGDILATVEVHGDRVSVTLDDDGPGIAAHHRDTVFEPFFTDKPGGMGMGLAISRAIIEAHDGRLVLTEASGTGACFQLSLPRYQG